jgi:uncharacterized protein YeaO (DUF488 family)
MVQAKCLDCGFFRTSTRRSFALKGRVGFDRLRTLAQHGRITLVYSAHDEAHNDAVVLKDLLLGRRVNR